MKYFYPVLIVGSDESQRWKKAQALTASVADWDQLIICPSPSIRIDQIRKAISFVNLTSTSRVGKAVIVREAQTMTPEAQNAFLKTLEEPPPGVRLILTSPSTDLILPTIVSRCQIDTLGPPQNPVGQLPPDQLISSLKKALADGIPGCFFLADQVASSSLEAQDWLRQTALIWRGYLLSKPKHQQALQLVQAVRIVDRTRGYLRANANVRLALEVCLLDLLELRYNRKYGH